MDTAKYEEEFKWPQMCQCIAMVEISQPFKHKTENCYQIQNKSQNARKEILRYIKYLQPRKYQLEKPKYLI